MAITTYTISPACRQAALRSGFDIDNPNKRTRVQNPLIQHVLSNGKTSPDKRREQLLKDRGAFERSKGRGRDND